MQRVGCRPVDTRKSKAVCDMWCLFLLFYHFISKIEALLKYFFSATRLVVTNTNNQNNIVISWIFDKNEIVILAFFETI